MWILRGFLLGIFRAFCRLPISKVISFFLLSLPVFYSSLLVFMHLFLSIAFLRTICPCYYGSYSDLWKAVVKLKQDIDFMTLPNIKKVCNIFPVFHYVTNIRKGNLYSLLQQTDNLLSSLTNFKVLYSIRLNMLRTHKGK